MEQLKWMENLVSFMKASFEATMNTMTTLQEQGEKMLNSLLDQGIVAQQEGRKVLSEWLEMAKKGREDYKRLMTQSMEKVTEFFKTAGGSKGK